ncbi:MAG: M23 family metallopeptidase [Treponemataceae bacterium]
MTARTLAGIIFIVCFFALTVSAQETIHVLKRGETLYSLARSYGVPYSSLLRLNKINDANKLKAGQKILIPVGSSSFVPSVSNSEPASKHTVGKGETLFGIAKRYDLTVSELRTLNNLKDKSVLFQGDVLVLSRTAKSTTTKVVDTPVVSIKGITIPSKAEEFRPVTAKRNDPSVKWPVHVKELAYIEGKLYGVLLIGEQTERVQSLSAGTVVSAETYRGFGRVAIVQAPDGHVYVYGGNESLSVKAGDRIASGAELGRLGVDSLTGKPSLFFFVYKDNVAIDPAKAPRS